MSALMIEKITMTTKMNLQISTKGVGFVLSWFLSHMSGMTIKTKKIANKIMMAKITHKFSIVLISKVKKHKSFALFVCKVSDCVEIKLLAVPREVVDVLFDLEVCE